MSDQQVFTDFAQIFGREQPDGCALWQVTLTDWTKHRDVATLYVSAKSEHAAREIVTAALIGPVHKMGTKALLDAAKESIQSQVT